MIEIESEFTKTNLFSCPIYKIKIDPKLYDKEKIIKDILYNKSLKNTRNEPHQNIGDISNIHHSYMDFDNEDFKVINYEKLLGVYTEKFNELFSKEIHTKKEFKFNFGIVNYSAATEGQWMPVHNHLPTDDFACIHYLNFKDGHNFTRFTNPLTFAPHLEHIQEELYDILDSTNSDNSYMWKQFMFPVEEDDMLIFPASLNHEVSPQGATEEPRITIATNIWIPSQKRNNMKDNLRNMTNGNNTKSNS
jgi:hypothetical protein